MNPFEFLVSDIYEWRNDNERDDLISADWPVSGDDLARYVACV